MATFLQIQTRANYLIGESSTTGASATLKSHINAFVQDIANTYPLTSFMAKTTLTVVAGVSDLPANYNPKWGLLYVTDASGNKYTQIPLEDQANYGDTSYVWWRTYNTTTSKHVFNSLTLTGTITAYYYFLPTDMSADVDVCVITDLECVAYGGASKNWIGDERNTNLAANYAAEAGRRLVGLYQADMQFGPQMREGTPLEYNDQLWSQ